MSNFSYKDASGNVIRVPVRYGDASRQASAILNKNTENVMPSAPFIACYIKELKFDRERMQDPTYISKLNIRERQYGYEDEDPNSPTYGQTINEYANIQGGNYTIERLMPTPYMISFTADIWTSNFDQKLQLWEQITVLFNPAIELQTTDNYVDWTSLSYLELMDTSTFESRAIPQGLNNDLSIASLQFTAPAWISPPAKVKKLGIITKIISNVFAEPTGTGDAGGYDDAFYGGNIFGGLTPDSKIVVTSGDYGLLVLNNTAVLVPHDYMNVSEGWIDPNLVPDRPSWMNLLDLYPGKFNAGLSQIRLTKPDGNEIVAYISLNPTNEALMALNFDQDTVPANTILTDHIHLVSRGTIDAIINPQTFNPHTTEGENVDLRYLILEDVVLNQGEGVTEAWTGVGTPPPNDNSVVATIAHANDIIQWDGFRWWVLFDSANVTTTTYITNAYTNIQYKWDGSQWSKSYEGVYTNENWRLIL